MTSDRPYSRARSLEDAAAEIRSGRGTQFAPAVVDAFFAALRRDPAAFAPDSEVGSADGGRRDSRALPA
jgi:HD-GYP domain-containing protein (c-di-GMP phosphodiesterase class II)